jgi:RNA polymerase sigma factor (sigma-70 family)
MDLDEPDPHLSRIETSWTLVFQAHHGPGDAASTARAELLGRYGGAARGYLRALAHDPEVAAELAQEFAVRFLRGDFRRADPGRGRFRDLVKSALRNLLIDHQRRQRVRPRQWGEDLPEPADPAASDREAERRFLDSWRRLVLDRAWEALARIEGATGRPLHTVLRHRADHPELHSPELAEQLSGRLGKPVGPVWVRQVLHRARRAFVDCLMAEVAQTLEDPTPEGLEQELGELGLLDYCRRSRGRRDRGDPADHG